MPADLPRVLALTLLSLFVCSIGCTFTAHPLTNEENSVPDLRLLGNWEVVDVKLFGDWQIADLGKTAGKLSVNITLKKDSKTVLHVIAIDEGKPKEYDLFCTKIGDDLLASSTANGQKDGSIAKYQLDGDTSLKLWRLKGEFFAAAIADKDLNGTVVKKDWGVVVSLDDTPEHIRNFIEKNSAKCFGEEEIELKLKKIQPTE